MLDYQRLNRHDCCSFIQIGWFMDPLEDVFRSMRVESALYGRLEATAPWAVAFADDQRVKFGMLVRGACWLSVTGEPMPLALRSGDCFVLTGGRSFSVA